MQHIILIAMSIMAHSASSDRKQKILLLSLDYDGCADDILKNSLAAAGHMYPLHYREELDFARKKLHDVLQQQIDEHDNFEVIVGSARQSQAVEEENRARALEQAMITLPHSKKRVFFYDCAGIELNGDGFAIVDFRRYAEQNGGKFDDTLFPHAINFRDEIRGCKWNLIMKQMKHASEKHKDNYVTLFFLDDREDILKEIVWQWKVNASEGKLPSNVTLKIGKFDRIPAMIKMNAALTADRADWEVNPYEDWTAKLALPNTIPQESGADSNASSSTDRPQVESQPQHEQLPNSTQPSAMQLR